MPASHAACQTQSQRSAFLRAMGGARVEPTLTIGKRTSASACPGLATANRNEPALATGQARGAISVRRDEAAQAALAFFVGPIARVLVRNAAAQAVSARDFIDRLCAHVSKPDEVTALRRRLRAEVEPQPGDGAPRNPSVL